MKIDIDKALSPTSAGAWRGNACIVPGRRGPKDVEPAGVAVVLMGEGQTIRILLSTLEARGLGEMLLVCGAVAEGGPPPVVAPAEPAGGAYAKHVINSGRA